MLDDLQQIFKAGRRPVAVNTWQRIVHAIRHHDDCAAAILNSGLPHDMFQDKSQSIPKVCAAKWLFNVSDTFLQSVVIVSQLRNYQEIGAKSKNRNSIGRSRGVDKALRRLSNQADLVRG